MFLRLEIIFETHLFNVSANRNVSNPSLKIGMINKKVPYSMGGQGPQWSSGVAGIKT
jgi:hypothetical protein